MADTKWTIKGREFVNCNCSYGCPCQFDGLPTHGHCQAVGGFEYTLAEIGRGWTKTSRPIRLELADSYGQFAEIHLCQSGIVR